MNVVIKSLMGVVLVLALVLGPQAVAFGVDGAEGGMGMQMILEMESRYGFEETTMRLEEKVLAAGWSIVQVFDYKEILGSKGFDILDIKIYAVCSGKYSGAILERDDERMVAPLMPCRISVYEKSDGLTYIALMNSREVAVPFGGVIAKTMQAVGAETLAMIEPLVVEGSVPNFDRPEKPYDVHVAWFDAKAGGDGILAYAMAIRNKETMGETLSDSFAANAFRMDFPMFFMEEPMQMLLEDESPLSFDDTVAKLKSAVEENGWSVVGEFDYKEILSSKGFDILDIKIIAVCSGKHSAEILVLDDERMVSPLMPCTIAVYEKSDGKTYVSRLNSGEVAVPVGGVISEVMQKVSVETEGMIQWVLESEVE